ncbi:MAG: hypothetical protein ACI9QL_004999 [Candidatus Omnitrophota bacterium]
MFIIFRQFTVSTWRTQRESSREPKVDQCGGLALQQAQIPCAAAKTINIDVVILKEPKVEALDDVLLILDLAVMRMVVPCQQQ